MKNENKKIIGYIATATAKINQVKAKFKDTTPIDEGALLNAISLARIEVDAINVPARATTIYLSNTPHIDNRVMISLHFCGICGVYIGSAEKDNTNDYPCPICEQDNKNKISYEYEH